MSCDSFEEGLHGRLVRLRKLGNLVRLARPEQPELHAHPPLATPADDGGEGHLALGVGQDKVNDDLLRHGTWNVRLDEHPAERDVSTRALQTHGKVVVVDRELDRLVEGYTWCQRSRENVEI
jgi:hypothetical protein